MIAAQTDFLTIDFEGYVIVQNHTLLLDKYLLKLAKSCIPNT